MSGRRLGRQDGQAMGEALGIDLRVAACAVARWRDGAIEPCLLGDDGAADIPTAKLMAQAGGSATHEVDAVEATRAALTAVAALALGGEAVEAVGVAYALTPDDGPRRLVEQAAAAFDPAFLVPRPVAAVARFQHGGGAAGGDVAVLDMDANDVEIAVVRSGRDGYDVLGTSRVAAPPSDTVDMAAHLNDAVTAFETLLAAVVGGNAGVQAVVAVGRSEWLDQLGVQVRVATGLTVSVDPEPALAAAMGAALLAGGPDRRGRSRIAGSAAVVGTAGVPLAQGLAPSAPAAGTEAGAALGDASSGSSEAGSGIGASLHDAASGGALAGAAIGAAPRGPRGPRGPSGARGARRRRVAIGAGAAMAALLLVAGTLAAFGGSGGGGDEVETGGGRTATTRARSDDRSPRDTPPTTVAGTSASTGADGAPGEAVPAGAGSSTTVAGSGAPAVPGSPAPSGGSTPTTAAGAGDPPPTTAPTAPADTAGPSVGGLARSPGVINENGLEFCGAPFTSVVSASISDPSGITSAVVTWSGNGDSGTAPMTLSGSIWSATVGPVADNTDLDHPQADTITWTVTALDGAGNATSVTGASITVQGC